MPPAPGSGRGQCADGVAGDRLRELGEGLQRPGAEIGFAIAAMHRHPRLGRLGQELAEQPALADAGRPGDEHRPGSFVGQPSAQPRQLGGPPRKRGHALAKARREAGRHRLAAVDVQAGHQLPVLALADPIRRRGPSRKKCRSAPSVASLTRISSPSLCLHSPAATLVVSQSIS